MSNTEKIIELNNSNMSAGDIAKELGLSRARVYQIGKQYNLKFASRSQPINSVAFKALIAKGKTLHEIAVALGISYSRSYQFAKANGIPLPKRRYGPHPSRNRPAPPSKPRLLTGGVPVQVSSAVVGKVSEVLVAADLMARGWHVYLPLVHRNGHDVIATSDGRIITVEVRSAYRTQTGNISFTRTRGCKSSHYALVVTGEPVLYEPEL